MDTKPGNPADVNKSKHQADSSDNPSDMLQHERLIDPGNEHSHHVDEEKKQDENKGDAQDDKM